MQTPMRFAGLSAAARTAGVSRLGSQCAVATTAGRRWASTSTEDRGTAAATAESAPAKGEGEEERMTPYAYQQEAAYRKDPIRPYIDGRSRDPLYNPVVDDWVDFNNPRWKVRLPHSNWPPPLLRGDGEREPGGGSNLLALRAALSDSNRCQKKIRHDRP
jgi:hypothetical protein